MPIYEAAAVRSRGGLTQQQKREAEAAIYGLGAQEQFMSTNPTGLTAEEIERMRALIAQHDQQNGAAGMKEFDLNNPPVKQYVHQEFPRCIYHHGRGKTKVVNTAKELAAHEAKGWLKQPPPPAPSEDADVDPNDDGIELNADDAAKAADIDAKAKQKPAK